MHGVVPVPEEPDIMLSCSLHEKILNRQLSDSNLNVFKTSLYAHVWGQMVAERLCSCLIKLGQRSINIPLKSGPIPSGIRLDCCRFNYGLSCLCQSGHRGSGRCLPLQSIDSLQICSRPIFGANVKHRMEYFHFIIFMQRFSHILSRMEGNFTVKHCNF